MNIHRSLRALHKRDMRLPGEGREKFLLQIFKKRIGLILNEPKKKISMKYWKIELAVIDIGLEMLGKIIWRGYSKIPE